MGSVIRGGRGSLSELWRVLRLCWAGHMSCLLSTTLPVGGRPLCDPVRGTVLAWPCFSPVRKLGSSVPSGFQVPLGSGFVWAILMGTILKGSSPLYIRFRVATALKARPLTPQTPWCYPLPPRQPTGSMGQAGSGLSSLAFFLASI